MWTTHNDINKLSDQILQQIYLPTDYKHCDLEYYFLII